jgi:glycine/D-amino acid oxidase-like deaminating enzyme
MAIDLTTHTLRRPADSRPTILEADIAVLGSGAAGMSAALEAAKLGKRVAIVDGAPQLGGQAVGAMVGTFCGLFSNGKAPYQVTYGVAADLLRDLGASGDLHDIVGRRNTIIVQYRVTAVQRWFEEQARKAGLVVLLGAVLRDAVRDDRRVTSLMLATRYGDVELRANGFVDASGDAALTWTAGMEVREGAHKVFGTMMFTLEHTDDAALNALDRAEIGRRLKEKGAAYGLVRQDGFIFATPGAGESLVNMTHIETPMDPVGAGQTLLEGHAQVDRVVQFLRSEFPSVFQHARVRSYGQPGIRQTRTIAGRHTLTADEVRYGARFDDAILRCAWPIEFHGSASHAQWEEFDDDHLHYVPFRSLTPVEADNVVAAGRCIDADPVALSSVRVMGPCMAMGAAAAHALDLAGAGSVHQIDMAALKRRIAANLERRDP